MDRQTLITLIQAAATFGLVLALWMLVLLAWRRRKSAEQEAIARRLAGQAEAGAGEGRALRLWHEGNQVVRYVPGLHNKTTAMQRFGFLCSDAGFKSLLTMAEAPDPWGPWTVFYRDLFEPQIDHNVFQWSFAPKWFRNGGRDFTLIFSGVGVNDSWNTIDGTFTTTP